MTKTVYILRVKCKDEVLEGIYFASEEEANAYITRKQQHAYYMPVPATITCLWGE